MRPGRPRVRRGSVVAAVSILALASGACGRGPLELRAGHHERVVPVQVGETVILRLDENPSAGLEWRFTEEPDPTVLELLSRDHEPPDDPAPGAGGTAVWRFRALAPGSTGLALEYVVTYEPGTVADTFALDFEVAADRT